MTDAHDEAAIGQVCVSADHSDWRDISPPVRSIDVEDHEFLTDKATIILDDHTGVLSHASFEGLEVRVVLGWNNEKATIFEGVVSGSRAVTQQAGPQVELTALDFTYRMSRHTPDPPMQWHSGEKLSEIVKSIVQRAEYRIVPFQIEPATDPTFNDDNPLRQANENDFDFVQRLARDYNCRAFIEFDGQSSSKFYFVPVQRLASAEPIGLLKCCRGMGDLISFELERVSSGSLVERTSSATDPTTGDTVTHPAAPVPARPALTPPAPERNPDLSTSQRDAVQALTELAASAEANLQPARQHVGGESSHPAAAAGRVVPDPTRLLGFSGKGVATGTVKLRAKSRVKISGIAPWAEGDWYVTKVNHVYTRQRVGHRQSTTYVSNFKATR